MFGMMRRLPNSLQSIATKSKIINHEVINPRVVRSMKRNKTIFTTTNDILVKDGTYARNKSLNLIKQSDLINESGTNQRFRFRQKRISSISSEYLPIELRQYSFLNDTNISKHGEQNAHRQQHLPRQQEAAVKVLMETLIASQSFLPGLHHPLNASNVLTSFKHTQNQLKIDNLTRSLVAKQTYPWMDDVGDSGNTSIEGKSDSVRLVETSAAEKIVSDEERLNVDVRVDVNSLKLAESVIPGNRQSRTNDLEQWKSEIQRQLFVSIKHHDPRRGMEILRRAIQIQKNQDYYNENNNDDLLRSTYGRLHSSKPNIKTTYKVPNIDPSFIPISMVHRLFKLIPNDRPFDLYQTLLYYHQIVDKLNDERITDTELTDNDKENDRHCKEIPFMYHRLCESMKHIDPMRHSFGDTQNLVRSILWDIQTKLNWNEREKCYPTLISSLAIQRSVPIGETFTAIVYKHVNEMKYNIPDSWYEHILQHSKYYRQNLPYADILHSAVFEKNRRPHPSIVFLVIDNLFPFTNTQAIKKAIQSVIELQKQTLTILMEREQEDLTPIKEYKMDMGVLEAIGSVAARQGDLELNTLLWDLIDLYQYEPTLAFYENTAIVFSRHRETYSEAFHVVMEIENKFKSQIHPTTVIDKDSDDSVPSRALIRGMSTNMRVSKDNIYEAIKQIDVLYQNGTPITVSCINVILSCLAERGDSDSAFHVLFNDFDKYDDVEPNADSYCFALESLGKHVLRATRHSSADDTKAHCIRQSEKLLNIMEEQNIVLTHHIIYEYTELLCQTDQISTASDVVFDAHREFGYVHSKVIYRVAMANSKAGNHEMAYKIASLADIEIPRLFQNLNGNELLDRHKRKEFLSTTKNMT